jgi:hypothetical protein
VNILKSLLLLSSFPSIVGLFCSISSRSLSMN